MESPKPKRELSEAGEREWELKEMAERHAKELDAQQGLNEWEMEERTGEDHLTRLKNRKFFENELERSLKAIHAGGEGHHRSGGEPLKELSLLFVDLNKFKQVNDTLGHAVGDEVLVKVAGVLTASVREADVVARYGGDEFCILLPRANEHGAAIIADKIHANLGKDPVLGKFGVTASIGVRSVDASNVVDAKTLLEQADAAMYNAKQKGKEESKI